MLARSEKVSVLCVATLGQCGGAGGGVLRLPRHLVSGGRHGDSDEICGGEQLHICGLFPKICCVW